MFPEDAPLKALGGGFLGYIELVSLLSKTQGRKGGSQEMTRGKPLILVMRKGRHWASGTAHQLPEQGNLVGGSNRFCLLVTWFTTVAFGEIGKSKPILVP